MGADKITVLNIDDNEAARYVRRRLMSQAGFEVEDASTGAEALRLVEQVRPQLMLLDVRLPDVDGFEISRQVRQSAIGDQVVIIHISAEAPDASSQVTGLETGADAYLVEPVDPNVLVATARALLRARAAEKRERDEIARLRRSEEALRESEARLARTQEFSHVMTLHVSLDGRWLRLPPTFVRFLGYDNESEIAGRRFDEFTHPDDFWADWTQVQQLLRGEIKSFEMEKRFIRKDGSFTWGYLNCSIVTDEQGKPVHLLTYVRDINAQKKAEEALRESEERFRNLADNMSQFAWMTDAGGWVFWYNRRWYEYTGTTLEEMRGWGWQEVHHPDHVDRVVRRIKRSFETGEPWEDTFPLRGKDGCYRWFLSRALPIRDDAGRIVRWFGTNTDITEHLEFEERLRQSEQRYRGLFESMHEGFALAEIILDSAGKPVDWRYLDVNPAFESLHGRTRAETIGRTFRELFPEAKRDWVNACGEVATTGKPAHLEEFDAGRYWDASIYSAGPQQFAIVHNDMTGRKLAEDALRESRAKLQAALSSMMDGVVITDAQGRFLELNDAFATFHRFSNKQECARTFAEYPEILEAFLPDGTPAPVEMWTVPRALRGETGTNAEYTLRRKDTGETWIASYSFSPVRDRNGAIAGSVVVARDITEQKRAEQALRESERQFRELADSMPQLVWITDAGGYVTFFNHQWYDQLGVPEEQSLGNGWEQFLHPEDRDRAHKVWHASVETGAPCQVEYRFRTANGEYRWFLARGVPIRDEHGRITRWYGTCTDIDESKRAEERLRQTQKLKSVGLLAGGIAHDFNNLLTGIIGNASLALEDVADARAAARIKDVMKSAERAANLTRQLLAYSGKGQFIVRDIDVSQAVNEIADLVQFSIPKSVELVMNVRTRLPLVRMDPTQLQQVLMNLVINAGEAIGEGNPGTITVATSTTHVDKPFIDAVGHEITPGRYVCIEVNDTGTGIDDDNKSKIFEPFFTTKFTGRGLGLAAVAGILRTQRGGVMVKSEPGSGSTFCVYLPAAEKGGENGEEPAASRATILVVDDEATVRDVISAVLRRRGFHVLTASEGRDALAVCEREKVNIDAAVVDVVMPVMGANELMPALKTRCPKIKILLTSGYSETEARRLCAAYPGATFIQKPYTAQQIAEAVEQLVKVAD